MSSIYFDILKILLGAVISIITTFVLLKAENQKQIITRRHEYALKELGEKLFSPLLTELSTYNNKIKLGRTYTLNITLISDCISKYQYLLFFTSDSVKKTIIDINEFCYSTSEISGDNITTQDALIINKLEELKDKLTDEYSKYRM
ncbi:hypothetical protein O9H85_28835 [Paenibacillus filicis]|uniref:Uncharacterized protein n=1 Tax=Paenibacillus gyeongsangnamensis TaxID=3388067 RepID=A0ABT4QHF1_9BACL|nr:hypothetical protein [Paenibacillus filicis]MCZ8516327.1 hypothetical protein [Paenibacillus filicis]